MALAQRVTAKPLMANHHHGLWGYSGRTHAGRELTVQAGGIGGPSTAVVIGELATHGALRIVRIGRRYFRLLPCVVRRANPLTR